VVPGPDGPHGPVLVGLLGDRLARPHRQPGVPELCPAVPGHRGIGVDPGAVPVGGEEQAEGELDLGRGGRGRRGLQEQSRQDADGVDGAKVPEDRLAREGCRCPLQRRGTVPEWRRGAVPEWHATLKSGSGPGRMMGGRPAPQPHRPRQGRGGQGRGEGLPVEDGRAVQEERLIPMGEREDETARLGQEGLHRRRRRVGDARPLIRLLGGRHVRIAHLVAGVRLEEGLLADTLGWEDHRQVGGSRCQGLEAPRRPLGHEPQVGPPVSQVEEVVAPDHGQGGVAGEPYHGGAGRRVDLHMAEGGLQGSRQRPPGDEDLGPGGRLFRTDQHPLHPWGALREAQAADHDGRRCPHLEDAGKGDLARLGEEEAHPRAVEPEGGLVHLGHKPGGGPLAAVVKQLAVARVAQRYPERFPVAPPEVSPGFETRQGRVGHRLGEEEPDRLVAGQEPRLQGEAIEAERPQMDGGSGRCELGLQGELTVGGEENVRASEGVREEGGRGAGRQERHQRRIGSHVPGEAGEAETVNGEGSQEPVRGEGGYSRPLGRQRRGRTQRGAFQVQMDRRQGQLGARKPRGEGEGGVEAPVLEPEPEGPGAVDKADRSPEGRGDGGAGVEGAGQGDVHAAVLLRHRQGRGAAEPAGLQVPELVDPLFLKGQLELVVNQCEGTDGDELRRRPLRHRFRRSRRSPRGPCTEEEFLRRAEPVKGGGLRVAAHGRQRQLSGVEPGKTEFRELFEREAGNLHACPPWRSARRSSWVYGLETGVPAGGGRGAGLVDDEQSVLLVSGLSKGEGRGGHQRKRDRTAKLQPLPQHMSTLAAP